MMRRNAIIMAAGMSSRLVPLSAERPKGLLEVKGEIVIERQIRQLQMAGISDITVIVGYKAELFDYLKNKYSVDIVLNEDFARYNNTSSLFRVIDRLKNTYICSCDNYFPENVFIGDPQESYYSALFAKGDTSEYCMTLSADDYIRKVSVGGRNAWYMIGHVYFNEAFSQAFGRLLSQEYCKEETRLGYWEDVFIRYIDILPRMRVHRYKDGEIFEFDSLDELRKLDTSYVNDSRSTIIKSIAAQLDCKEAELHTFIRIKSNSDLLVFSFQKNGEQYVYDERLAVAIKQ